MFKLMLFFALVSLSLAQSKKVADYERFLESFSSRTEMKNKVKSYNLVDMKHAAKLIFESDDEDAVSTLQMHCEMTKRKRSSNKADIVTPWFTRKALLSAIKKSFDVGTYTLINVPYLLKVKILNIKKSKYKDPSTPVSGTATLPRTDIKAQVLEIIRGSSRFEINTIITFYFMDYWRPYDWDFQEGEECLVPLAPQTTIDCKYDLIALVTTLEDNERITENQVDNSKSHGRYPIIDNKVFDKNNYWGYGNNIDWEVLKSDLQRKCNTIKTW